jgi:hypothetical protein
MKHAKLFLSLAALLITFSAAAQITFQATYPGYPLFTVKLQRAGVKFVRVNTASNNITLYNLDHSVYRQITVPQQQANYNVTYLTETLFDTDSTDLDYALISSLSSNPNIPYFRIYNENGSLIFARDSCSFTWSISAIPQPHTQLPIINTDSGTVMILSYLTPSPSAQQFVYRLPGSLDCNLCVTPSVGSEMNGTGEIHHGMLMPDPYPNPTGDKTRIDFTLPKGEKHGTIILYDLQGKEIKRYAVDDNFNYLLVSCSEIAAGTYYYQLLAGEKCIAGKKIVVVK